jgi:GPI mannosyltransferase 3
VRAAARSLPPAVWAIALAGGLVRLVIGLTDQGLHWPDEVFQSLEPAHKLVFGYGLLPWEYLDGARSWALPGLFAGLLGAADLLGLSEPREYLPLVRLAMALVAAGTVLATYALARTARGSRAAGTAAAVTVAAAAPLVFFGHRPLGEVVTALPVTLGLALALRPGRRDVLLGASLLGLATVLRLQNGVFALALVLVLAGGRRWRAAGEATAVLAGWALVLGLLDRLTWGTWFGSAIEYLEFNLVEDGAARAFGTEPAGYYAETLWRAAPLVTALLGLGTLLAVRRAPALFAVVALDVVLLSATGHKELRFLVPALPALCALAATGLAAHARRLGPAALAAAAIASGVTAGGLTQHDVGQPFGDPDASAWHRFEDVDELLLVAHDRPDLCGLRIEVADAAFSGGLTWLHRDVPLYGPDEGPSGTFNYVIAGEPATLRKVADRCRPDPAYEGRLNHRAT